MSGFLFIFTYQIKTKMEKKKLTKTTFTLEEWFDALKVPTPHRNKKKYYKKVKHKGNSKDNY
jgi:hypothetical protein